MKTAVTGMSGYLGKLIAKALQKNGYEVTGIPRNLLYDSSEDALTGILKNQDVVINLAGATILQRWHRKTKKLIYDSRIVTTGNLVKAINCLPEEQRPKKFVSASAIGIYLPGELHDENSTRYDESFAGKVVQDWEKTLQELPDSLQLIIFRIGLVLGKKAKIIKYLRMPFKLGLGATIGNGSQPFPFVHEQDVARAFVWAVEKHGNSGVFNLVAPERVNNKEFTKTLASALNRPAFLQIPKFVFNIIFGESAVLLTESPEVVSEKLQHDGFNFLYPALSPALEEILSKTPKQVS